MAAFGLTLPEAATTPLPALLAAMRQGHAVDTSAFGLPTSLLRSARRSRIVMAPPVWPELAQNPAFALHVAGAGGRDPLFFLSHRHYLVRGLSASLRVQAAALHYRNEIETFSPDYVRRVYRGAGLRLWHRRAGGIDYDIRLMAGNDVAHEGGTSLVLHVDGARVGVMSYSLVPWGVLGADAEGPETLHLVTRQQSTADRAYRPAFARAFDETTPAHLCLAAMHGVVRALGAGSLAGVTGACQPAFRRALAAHFHRAYDAFWLSQGGRPVSRRAFVLPVPPLAPVLEDKTAARRRRALARRRHADEVEAHACAAVRAHLRG